MAGATKSRVTGLTCLVLGLLTLAAYWPVLNCEFIHLDDPTYVTQNAAVKGGLTRANARWALTANPQDNWHPLTWISHMLDVTIYGLNPAGHHATNLVLHIANTLLLFWVLKRLTGCQWRSAFVAAIFALHPMHVESVAWVSERKDVLSTFFWALTLWMYVRYIEKPGVLRYLPMALFYTLGLLSKSMIVTLPCLMLLLDVWPLRRMALKGKPPGPGAAAGGDKAGTPASPGISPARLVVEKLPLFVLSALSCAATLLTQGSGIGILHLPFLIRFENAFVACYRYIGQTLWPAKLVVMYPLTPTINPSLLGMAVGTVLLMSFLAFRAIRKFPYVFTGWFWFVGTLVPVIGLVQVGLQSMADRYTYVPMIGLLILITWGVRDLFEGWRLPRAVTAAMAGLPIAACLLLTRAQIGYWHDSVTLFEHTLQYTTNNFTIEDDLAVALSDRGDQEGAAKHFANATRIYPKVPQIHYALAYTLMKLGRYDQALPELLEAIRLKPDYAEALSNLGLVLFRSGKTDEAITRYRMALHVDPDMAETHYNLSCALVRAGHIDEAIRENEAAVRLKPDLARARSDLGALLLHNGRVAEAKAQFAALLQQAPGSLDARLGMVMVLAKEKDARGVKDQLNDVLRLHPDDDAVRLRLGDALAESGMAGEACKQFSEAVRINPTNAVLHSHLAMALSQAGNVEQAVENYRQALALNPKMPLVLNNLAWIRAADSRPQLRNGEEAVRLAEQACDLTGHKNALFLGTLAAAYAEAGRFDEAAETAGKARDLAADNPELADKNARMRELFLARKPYHEP